VRGTTCGSSSSGGAASSSSSSDEQVLDLGSNKRVTISTYGDGKPKVDMRGYYADKTTGEMKPTQKGISLSKEAWELLKKNIDKIDSWLYDDGDAPKKGSTAEAAADEEQFNFDF